MHDAGPSPYRSALDRLRAAQKPARGTAAYSRLVNRPLGRRVAAYASTVGMTPDQATGLSALCSGVGIAMIALVQPRWWVGIVVGLALMAGYVMDSVDGQLARLAGRGSVRGEWLDHTVDCIKTLTLHSAVLVAWFRWSPFESTAALLIPLGYTIVASTTFFGWILMWSLRAKNPSAPSAPVDGDREHPLRMYLLLPTDYGALCVAFLLLGFPSVFAVVYSFFFAAAAAALALALVKWWRELTVVDSERSGISG